MCVRVYVLCFSYGRVIPFLRTFLYLQEGGHGNLLSNIFITRHSNIDFEFTTFKAVQHRIAHPPSPSIYADYNPVAFWSA
jgi:hypothetical protein